MIKFTCSDCGFAVEVEEAEAGKLVRCQSCKSLVAVPQGDDAGEGKARAAVLETISESRQLERGVTAARAGAVLIGGGALLLTGIAIFCSIMGTAATQDNGTSDAAPAVQPLNHPVGAGPTTAPTTAPTASTDANR